MAPKRGGSKQQQKLNVDQFTLLKKPMEHLGKHINVPGSFWQGRMLEEERDPDAGLIMKDFPSTLSLKDRELRDDKNTFTTKESDDLCTAVTTARKVSRDELNARVFHGSSDLRPSNTRLMLGCQADALEGLPAIVVERSCSHSVPQGIEVARGTSAKFRPEPHASD